MEYHLIIEFQYGEQDSVKQYGIINSRLIRNIPIVNPETCYTGKSIVIDIDGEMVPAIIIMISDDLNFIRDQFREISMPPTALTSEVSSQVGTRHHSPDSATQEPPVNFRAPPMTFDQQTQTDRKLYEGTIMNQQHEDMLKLQQQCCDILKSVREISLNGVIFNNNLNEIKMKQEEATRRLIALEEKLNQGHNIPPDNSVYLQLTPEGSTPTENVTDEASEHKPIKTYRSKRKGKSAEDDQENVTPKAKRTKKSSKVADCSPQEMEYKPEEDIVIGPNGTKISAIVVKSLNWANYSVATRRILVEVFSKEVLATHSLSGKPSPAFLDRNAKKQLDPHKIQDIILFVTKNANVLESNVRSIITAKCADENKMIFSNKQ